MIDPQKITFPISYEEITAMQAAEVGRELTAMELELFLDLEAMANTAYFAAAQGDVDTAEELLSQINSIPVRDDADRHLTGLFKGWVLLAIRRGAESLEAAANGLS